jgi:hypothetical protein
MYLFASIFLCTAICIFLFKNEFSANARDADEPEDRRLSLFESYKVIWDLFKLPAVRELTFVLLTASVSYFGPIYKSSIFIVINN